MPISMFRFLAALLASLVLLTACNDGGGGGSSDRNQNPNPPPDSGSWGAEQAVESQGNDALQPKVAIDANGNAIAVWKQSSGGRYDLWANRYEAGTGWGTATLLEYDDRGDATTPKVAFDGDGNALVVWFQYDGSHYYVWSNRYTPGVGWAGAENLQSNLAQSGYYPELSMTADGNAVAFWQQIDPGLGSTMWSNRYTAGVGWGVAEQVSNSSGFAYSHDVATDAAGNAIAVWGVNENTLYSLWYSRYDTVAGWSTPQLLENQDSANAYYPRLVMDDAGNAMVVWIQGSGNLHSLWARRYAVGSGWNAAQLIETDDTGGVSPPQLAMDASGNVLVVWQQYNGSVYNIWSNRYRARIGWGTAQMLDTTAGTATYPHVAMNAGGDGVAVWQQQDGAYSIWSRRFE